MVVTIGNRTQATGPDPVWEVRTPTSPGITEGTMTTRTTSPPPADVDVPDCRGREILDRVGDKWSVYVVHTLGEAGTLRFSALKRRIEGISQRMLTVTLRSLERDGLVDRTVYPEVPPRVEYTLTELGATLRSVVGELVAWSVAHLPEIDAARERYDARDDEG